MLFNPIETIDLFDSRTRTFTFTNGKNAITITVVQGMTDDEEDGFTFQKKSEKYWNTECVQNISSGSSSIVKDFTNIFLFMFISCIDMLKKCSLATLNYS